MQGKSALLLILIAGIALFTACGDDHAPPKTKDITSFVVSTNMNSALLEDATVTIDGTNIMVVLPWGVEATNLVPTIEHSGRDISPPPGTPVDLSSPVVYTLTAGNGSTKQYLVTVTRLCLVTFDSGGGSAVSNQNVLEGGKVSEPAYPVRDGYDFGGWYREADHTTIWSFGNDTVTTNMTLYARWTGFGLVQTAGGSANDYAHGCAVDTDGNIYVAGSFEGSVDFDPGSGADLFTSLGTADMFLTRYNADGSYAWTRAFGSSQTDRVNAVAVDGSGNFYITGYFHQSVDFDPGYGVDSHTSAGAYDVNITKFSANGSYAWTRTLGGTGGDMGYGIAFDAAGNVLVVGGFTGTVDFDPGSGTDNRTAAGLYDLFVTKLGSSGSYLWTKTMGGTGSLESTGIAVDNIGDIVIAGKFSGTADFDPDAGTNTHACAGVHDVFITKLSNDGSHIWTKTIGGSGIEKSAGLGIDGSGNIYVAGSFSGTVDFDTGTGTDNRTASGGLDLFVVKLAGDGSTLWARTVGGTADDSGDSIAVDGSGNVFYGGYVNGAVDFDPGAGTDILNASTSTGFVSSLDSSGTYRWTWPVGIASVPTSLALDGSGKVYAAGYFSGTVDFDPGVGIENRTAVGINDFFILKLTNR